MTFAVNGIQQKGNTTTPLQLVVETDSSLLVRKFLEKYHILILSLKEYTQKSQTFGDVRAKIKRGFDGITVISDQSNINVVCELFLRMGMDILEINRFSDPLPINQTNALIAQLQEKIVSERKDEEEVEHLQETKEKKIYSDPRLSGAKTVVERIFDRIPVIIQNLEGTLDAQEIKKIHTMQDDLKKLRMGNNYEKIRDLADQMLTIMQEWETRYYSIQESQATLLIDDSLLTDVDVAREEMKQSYTQQRKMLGIKISLIKEDYALFGTMALLRKFFQKDVLHKILQPQIRLYYLHDIAYIMTGFLLSLAGFFLIYNIFRPVVDNLSSFRLQVSKVGILGLLLFVGSFLKKKHIGNLILIYGLTALAYRLLVKLIITNFAL